MPKKHRKNQKPDKQTSSNSSRIPIIKDLQSETIQAIIAIGLFMVSIFFIFSAFGHKTTDALTTCQYFSYAGKVGNCLFYFGDKLLGLGYYLLPISLILLGISFLKTLEHKFAITKIFGVALFFLSGLGLIALASEESGGILGKIVAQPMIAMFGEYVSFFFLLGTTIISLLITFNTHLKQDWIMFWKQNEDDSEEDEQQEIEIKKSKETEVKVKGAGDEDTKISLKEDDKVSAQKQKDVSAVIKKDEKIEKDFIIPATRFALGKKFTPPPLSLLADDKGKPGVGDIKANANIIKRTLQNFGIDVEMDEISIGPSVTRYAMKPAEGVKLSRILGLQNNLSLALAAHPLRIEAPIPGKSLVGIEIPNTIKTTVGLGNLLSQSEFQESDKHLLMALGKGVSGKAHFSNLAKMPHLLIAGATGSGKSVTIHALIASMLYRNPPENLRFIMVDPKRVELTLYNGIPHLLTPVITDAKKAILALKWAAKEMDRRYNILEEHKVRDIGSYHKTILEPALKKLEKVGKAAEGAEVPEQMPYIIFIIDELADIMQTYPRELEAGIVRLAQMSRAVGIHLMLSTQRPSVNVITGLIKANVPGRIALQVASQIDSRTILDMGGAEKLLGAGDMLYMSGEMSTPERVQSAYVTENELKNVVKHIIDAYKDDLPQSEISFASQKDEPAQDVVFNSFSDDTEGSDDDDDLYEDAKETVISAGKASTSYIQRKLRVGYARAARLMDMLEERGVIGAADGARPREVLDPVSKTESGEDAVKFE